MVIRAIVSIDDWEGNNCCAKSIAINEYKIEIPNTCEGLSSAFFGLRMDSSI